MTDPTPLVRLGRDAATTAADLGPLANLVGTWVGSQGWELIAVPATSDGTEEFTLIVRPYAETMTFAAIGAPVPNRGGPAGDLSISGLLYRTRINDRETGEVLHVENGMWLNLGDTQQQPIVRQASIPHGDVLLALGGSQAIAGPPDIPLPSAIPDAGPAVQPGYTDPYLGPPDPFSPATPNEVLRQAIAEQTIITTTELSVSTEGRGTIGNIPFVTDNVNATKFTCTYWIETVEVSGQQVLQLQYSQQTDLEFIQQFGNPGELIIWPHVNVNTLAKQ